MAASAAVPANDAQPTVVGEVIALPTDMVEEGERLRPVDPIHAEALAGLIRKDGQDDPIEVCRLPGKATYLLVTGAHRLAACRQLGIPVLALMVSPELAGRRRKEISENLFHRGLDPLDRASFVAELYALEKVRAGIDPGADPRTAGANVRWAKALKEQAADANESISFAYGFTERVAESVGLGVRSIQLDLALHRGLSPTVVARLRGLPIATNAGQLRALAKLHEAEQLQVLALIEKGEARGASDALAVIRNKPKPTMEQKAWSAFFGGWSRMSARQRRLALRELAEMGLPRGVTIQHAGGGDA